MAFAAQAHEVATCIVAGIAITVMHHYGRPGAEGAERVPPELEIPDPLPVRAVAALGRVPPRFVPGATAKKESLLREMLMLWTIPAGILRQVPASWFAAWFRRSRRHPPPVILHAKKLRGPLGLRAEPTEMRPAPGILRGVSPLLHTHRGEAENVGGEREFSGDPFGIDLITDYIWS